MHVHTNVTHSISIPAPYNNNARPVIFVMLLSNAVNTVGFTTPYTNKLVLLHKLVNFLT